MTHQNPEVADLLLARQMQREGASLDEIADVLECAIVRVDLMLWRWFGASAGHPTPGSRALRAA